MAVDPRVLQAIGDPTGGRLTDIATNFVKVRQQKIENERNAEKDKREVEEHKIKMMDLGTKEALAYTDTMKQWATEGEGKNLVPESTEWKVAFSEFQNEYRENLTDIGKQFIPEEYNSMEQINRVGDFSLNAQKRFHPENFEKAEGVETFTDYAKIPGTELYGQKSNTTGKYVNIKDSIDGNTSLGSSEFERHLGYLKNNKLITEEKYNELREDRAEGFAGEMTGAGRERLDEKQADRYNRETKALREEYTKGSEHFRGMGTTIDSAIAAMDSGDTKLSEILLNQVMSQVQDTNVRAFQMYGEFDKEFGNFAERVQGMLSRFFVGTRTQREADEIRNVLTHFNESYVQPSEGKLRDRYRQIGINQNKKPFDVVPPKNPEDVRDSQLLSREEKIKMIKEYFPDWKPQ